MLTFKRWLILTKIKTYFDNPHSPCCASTLNFVKNLMIMKKTTLFTLMLMLAQWTAFGQLMEQGNFMVGSTVGFSTADSKVTSSGVENEGLTARQFNVAPIIGYFVIDNLAAGLGADFTQTRVTEPNNDQTDDSDLLFGPFARYYFQAGDNVAFFLVGNFGFGNSKDEQLIGETKNKISTNVLAFGTGPGLTVYSKGGFALETIFKYNYARSTFDTTIGGVNTTTKTRTNQFSLSLGLQYYFGGFRKA